MIFLLETQLGPTTNNELNGIFVVTLTMYVLLCIGLQLFIGTKFQRQFCPEIRSPEGSEEEKGGVAN